MKKIGKFEIDKLAGDIEDLESGSEFKIETVKFCGSTGDPLINLFTSYAIDVFARQGKAIRLFTNGMGLERKDNSGRRNLESILKINNLNLSLDAGSDETIKWIKGQRADYNQILNGLSRLARRRESERKPNITVSFVVTKANYQDIENATRDVKDAGADLIRFKASSEALFPHSNGQNQKNS